MEFQGKCIIFSAPSGAGKTTIVRHLLAKGYDLQFSVSAASRNKREIETQGKDYYFLSVEEFKAKIAQNDFLEWEEVYKNNFYGTLKSEIKRIWSEKKHVIFDVDVQGGINLKKIFGDKALSIFVMPPSVDSLASRLEKRNTETPESLKRRVDKSKEEMEFSKDFDTILVNDNLEEAFAEAETLLDNFLNA
jgi:guanylate kinase